jgi:hypothetical protein|tara:strand:- start:91 stop:543 length:453 start_codon:yes stop_codon:yes gene_type:complete
MGASKKPLTWEELIETVEKDYPKATPDKILAHIQRTYGEKIMASSWKYEACFMYYHQRKEDKGKRNRDGKLITKLETCFKVAGSADFKTWWPRFMRRKYESISPGSHAKNLQILVNKNKKLMEQLKRDKGYYQIASGPRVGTGLGHTKKS